MTPGSILRVLCVGLLGGLAGLAFAPAFGGAPGPTRFLLAVGAASLTATAVGLAALALPRLPAPVAGLGGAAAVAATVAAVVRPGAEVLHGPWRLLTAALPVEPAGPEVAAVAAVSGWATLLGVLLAVYSPRPWPPLLPPLAGLVLALGVGASGRPLPAWYAVAGVVLAGGALAGAERARPSPTRLVAAAALAGVAGLVAGLVGPAAPGVGRRPPADLRALVPPPLAPRTGISPLQQYPALRQGTYPVRLTGTLSRQVNQLRMVTLTEFDGTYWTVAADYRRAGTVLPETPPTTAGRFEVTQQIRVETPGPLSWLPAAGRPTRISVAGLGVDEETGDLVVPRDGAVPRAYTATSVLVQPGADQLRYAEPVQVNRPVALPPATRQFVEAATRGRPAGSARLLALYDQFVQLGGFRYDVDQEAAGGHGLYQIQRLLTAKRGTSEQYASAFAVLARYLGFDARVVMGFRPEYDPGRATAFTITGRDVDAWAEVRFAGLGWVAMDPSPRTNTIGGKAAPAARPSPPPPSPAPSARPTDPASVPPPRDRGNGAAGRGGAWALPAALTGAAVLLAALLAGPAGKTARRVRRRRHRSPRVAIFGAWWETLDRLREAGLPASSAATTADVLAQAGGLAGAVPALRELAILVDRAGYAPEKPDDRLPAWVAAAEAARRIRGHIGPVRRVLGWFDPRPLWPIR